MPSGSTETLDGKIEHRCMVAQLGVAMQAVTGSDLMNKGTARKQNPPIPDGMTYSLDMLSKMVKSNGQSPRYSQMAYFLRRIRYLLRVYYDYRVGKNRHPDLAYCDWDKVFDVGLALHKIGLRLQLDLPNLRAAMAGGGSELETFLLEDELDVGRWRQAAIAFEQHVDDDEEADATDREKVFEIEEIASSDLAAHIYSWFYGDLSVALIMNASTSTNEREKQWGEKAMKRIVYWSTSKILRDVVGDSLTDAMRPIYWSKTLLIEFGQAGGLGALFGDWVMSICHDLAEKTLKTLPDACWENQTKKSLRAITQQIQEKINVDGFDSKNVIFLNAFYNIYRRYGIQPFHAASKRRDWRSSIVFYYLYHRIHRENLQMNTKADWQSLLKTAEHIPGSVRRRYKWIVYSVADKWDCIDLYGCCYEQCPEKKALHQLRDQRVRGVRDAEVEERLDRWGSKVKACAACQEVSYCSTECQKVHWKEHKPECIKTRSKRA